MQHYIKIVCSAVLVFFASPSEAQPISREHLTEHKPLMNEVWKTFDLLMYKVGNENGKKTYTPYFPPLLQKLHGKTVSLQGYLIPLKAGFRHNRFLLSVLPIDQCMFCGQNGIPAMVEVTLANNEKQKAGNKPILITGKVVLNAMDKKRTEIWIEGASATEK